ncbi:Tetratricopeptide repeat (TPR) superfamily protein [Trifolium repens]|nr:Tetratricopeptide repeat (TPR) superfamily protein [Trifolium repens]
MGSSVSPNLECWKLRTLCSFPSDSWKSTRSVSSLPLKHVTDKNKINGFSFSKNLRGKRVNRACSCSATLFDDFHFHNDENRREILEPSFLGIQPEPPSWPEREEILRLSFERKVKSVGIPLSIRMIKKKLQLEEGLKNEVNELNNCSVKKSFSSLLFMLHELQNHALETRESLCGEDLKSVMVKLNREMDDSFVWLFQQVFSETPTLMIDVMVFLSNFSVFSMSNNNTFKDVNTLHGVGVQDECVKEELTEEEEKLWNFMLDEASKMQKELRGEDLDHETMMKFVSQVSVEIEGDQYEEYEKTEAYYKKHIGLTPYNSLLLSNYAQFLFLVMKDNDGAEEYYKQSVLVDAPEAEAYCRYADFLWRIRKDDWAAELRYLQALEADPGNTFYLSKYASFLWNTGGGQQENSNSFPIEELDNLQI